MKSYIKLPTPPIFPKSSTKQRELDDRVWKQYIFLHLLRFCQSFDVSEVQNLILVEKSKPRSEVEKILKKYLRQWLRNDERFSINGFIVDREPSTDGSIEGFYDLKFQHSYWKNRYFPFECKNMSDKATDIKEYVFSTSKKRNDGGVHRYFNGKYAVAQDFGGMIGFVLNGVPSVIVGKIIAELKNYQCFPNLGALQANGIVLNSIEGNSNTFDSHHCGTSGGTFVLHHILIEFYPAS